MGDDLESAERGEKKNTKSMKQEGSKGETEGRRKFL